MSGGNKMVEGKWNWRRANWAEMAEVVSWEWMKWLESRKKL